MTQAVDKQTNESDPADLGARRESVRNLIHSMPERSIAAPYDPAEAVARHRARMQALVLMAASSIFTIALLLGAWVLFNRL